MKLDRLGDVINEIVDEELDKSFDDVKHNIRHSSKKKKYSVNVTYSKKQKKQNMNSIKNVFGKSFKVSDIGIVENVPKQYTDVIDPMLFLFFIFITFFMFGVTTAIITICATIAVLLSFVKYYNYKLNKAVDISNSNLPHKEIDSFLNWEQGDTLNISNPLNKNYEAQVVYKGVTDEGYIVVHPLGYSNDLMRMSPMLMNRMLDSNKDMANRVKKEINYTDNRYSNWIDSYKEAIGDVKQMNNSDDINGSSKQMRRTREQ